MGLISPAGQNLLDFLELRQVLSTYDGNAGNSFPTTQRKNPSSRARRRNRGTSGYAGLSFLLSSGDVYVGELLELQQGCE